MKPSATPKHVPPTYAFYGKDTCLLEDWDSGLPTSLARLAVALFPVPIHFMLLFAFFRVTVDMPFAALAWLLQRIATPLLDPSSPAAQLFGNVTVVKWTLLAAWAFYWLALFRRPGPRQLPGHGMPLRIAVVGAGMSGIVSAKEMLDEGHAVDVFEQSDKLLGLWSESDPKSTATHGSHGARASTWTSTVTTSSALNSSFSDFPLPSKFEDQEYKYYVSRDRLYKYFMDYIEHFNIKKCVRFGLKVNKIQPLAAGKEGYDLTTSDGNTTHYDFVILATGLNCNPVIPDIPGMHEHFKGPISHSATWRGDAEPLRGKRVLVVGAGESGSDVVADVAPVAASTHLAVRGNTFYLARCYLGLPPDYVESRSLYTLPHFMRWPILFLTTFHLRNWRSSPLASIWLILHNPRDFFLSTSAFASLCITKADSMYKAVDRGLVNLHPAVAEFLPGDRVRFIDGREEQFDAVVFASGFKGLHTLNQLCPDLKMGCTRDLYRGVFLPGFQNLAFVGFCRGQVSGIIPMAEMQARWIALVASGKRALPEESVMRARRDEDQRNNVCHEQTRSGMAYLNFLARHEVGCEPDLPAIFLRSPTLFWKIWTPCVSSFTYRLVGPHAAPEVATKALMAIDTPWFMVHTDVINVLMAPWMDLPWLKVLRCFTPAIDTWY